MHGRVEARARSVDLCQELPGQVGLVHLALQLAADNDPVVVAEDVQDVDRPDVVGARGQLEAFGINGAQRP